jgi:hypothetical protein
MANPTWPAGLPQFVDEEGYGEDFEQAAIESPMDIGPPKIRRRQIGGFRRFSVSITVSDDAAVTTFDTFWSTTLKQGTLPFDWVHPRTQAALTFRFRNPPPKLRVRGEARTISFSLDTQL